MRVIGPDGSELSDRWAGDARAYLGMTVPGYPNFFLMYGPNTNIVINGSIIYFSECEARYITDAARVLCETGAASLTVRPDIHDEYNAWIDGGNATRAWGAASVNTWYRNEHGRISQNWPFNMYEFWRRTRTVDPADYVLESVRDRR